MLFESESLTCLNQAVFNDSFYRTHDSNPFVNLNLKHLFPQPNSLFSTANSSPSLIGLQQPEKISRTNLYIKGLPEDFSDDKLWELVPIKEHVKSVKAATEDDSKCRGYGFIDFLSSEYAQSALKHIQQNYPQFTIKFAKENEKDRTNLYVTNIPKAWTTKDCDKLKEVFEKFGHIQSAFVMVEKSSNKSNGVGFVRFANESEALATLDFLKNNPLIINGCDQPVEAKFADKHNPETRRRKNQPLAGTQLLANPLLNGTLSFAPTTFGGIMNPVATALGLGNLQGASPSVNLSNNGANSSLLHATMGLATANPSPGADAASLLQRAGVPNHTNSFPNLPGSAPNLINNSPSLDQFSGINFSTPNYFGLYNNQYYRNAATSVGLPQSQSWSQSPMLTDAVIAALSNGIAMKPTGSQNLSTGSYIGNSNPLSLQAAYQSLITNSTGGSQSHSSGMYNKNIYAANSCSGTPVSTPNDNSNVPFQGLTGAGTPVSINKDTFIYYE